MSIRLSNKFFKRFFIIFGFIITFVLIIGLYFFYTMFRVNQELEKSNIIDPIYMKYQILETVASGSSTDPRSQFSKDKLDAYNITLKSLCESQNIQDSECNLRKLKLENLRKIDTEMATAIQDLVELDSKLE